MSNRYRFLDEKPIIDSSAFVAKSADVMGSVNIGSCSSIWFNVTIRADIEKIIIGDNSNIQDNSVIHLSDTLGTKVGNWVTCGHKCLLHACEVEDESLIGMGAIVMDGAKVGARSIVGAGSLITQNMEIPSGSLVLGSPAKIIKKLDLKEQKDIRKWAEHYVEASREFKNKGY